MLTSKQLTVLSAEEKQELRVMETGFNSEFWSKIENIATRNNEAALRRAALAKNWDDHQKAVGEMNAWTTIMNFKDSLEHEYVAIAEQRLLDNEQMDKWTYE